MPTTQLKSFLRYDEDEDVIFALKNSFYFIIIMIINFTSLQQK